LRKKRGKLKRTLEHGKMSNMHTARVPKGKEREKCTEYLRSWWFRSRVGDLPRMHRALGWITSVFPHSHTKEHWNS
jgi:hypothetical protein